MTVAPGTVAITDKSGRNLVFLKTLRPSEQMRLLCMGGDAGIQAGAMRYWYGSANVRAAYMIESIDGEAVPRAQNKDRLDETMDRLGDDGVEAYLDAVEAPLDKAEVETVKNS